VGGGHKKRALAHGYSISTPSGLRKRQQLRTESDELLWLRTMVVVGFAEAELDAIRTEDRVVMDIAVIGAGYVGLIAAAGFAEIGHRVMAVDDDARKIELLNRGGMPFYEPLLGDLVKRNQAAKRLESNSQMAEAVAKCPAILICVGT
jgi:threonine dehydrogenase-like Zn-dependent dehydrogenase